MRARRVAAVLLVILAACAAYLYRNYKAVDLETLEIDDAARHVAPGGFVRTADGLTHYELAGPPDGRVVVLIHGFSVPAYLWEPTFRFLARRGFRVLRYDLFGRGLSDRPEATYNGEFYDAQLIELLNALHIAAPVDLVASSMGGPIAAHFVCRHPDRARSLSLFGPGYSHGQKIAWNLRLPLIGEYNFATKVAPHLAANQSADFLHPGKFPGWSGRYLPQMQYRGFRRSLLETLRNYLPEDWSREYACVGKGAAPVLLVWGRHDRDVPFETSKELRSLIPRVRFLPVEDAAHVPFLEHPEITNPALLDFLSTP